MADTAHGGISSILQGTSRHIASLSTPRMGPRDQTKTRSRRIYVLGISGSGHTHALDEFRLVHWHLKNDGYALARMATCADVHQCTCPRRNRELYEEPSRIPAFYMLPKVPTKFHDLPWLNGG